VLTRLTYFLFVRKCNLFKHSRGNYLFNLVNNVPNDALKRECLRVILVPLCEHSILRELALFADWYNDHRPHSALAGRTPAEVYRGVEPACQLPRFEPRARWPRGAPCSSPQAEVAGEPGAIVKLEVEFQLGRRHLPIVSLKLAA
jgi:hypothetical protein